MAELVCLSYSQKLDFRREIWNCSYALECAVDRCEEWRTAISEHSHLFNDQMKGMFSLWLEKLAEISLRITSVNERVQSLHGFKRERAAYPPEDNALLIDSDDVALFRDCCHEIREIIVFCKFSFLENNMVSFDFGDGRKMSAPDICRYLQWKSQFK